MSPRVPNRTAFAGLVVVLALALLSSHAFARQTRTQRGYLGTVTSPRVSTDERGHVVVSLEATGELRGTITIELDPDGSGGFSGKWAMAVAYTMSTDADGHEVAPVEQHEEEGPADPEHHREYIRFVNDGTINGTVQSASLKYGEDGSIIGISAAQLVVESGSVTFAGATGGGEIVPSGLDPAAGILSLNF